MCVGVGVCCFGVCVCVHTLRVYVRARCMISICAHCQCMWECAANHITHKFLQAKPCRIVGTFFINCDIRRVVTCKVPLLHLLHQRHQLNLDLVAQGQLMAAQHNFSDGGVLLETRAVHPSHLK